MVDSDGLRYQVLDATGLVRERLEWPIPRLPVERWRALPAGESVALLTGRLGPGRFVVFRFEGQAAAKDTSLAQTLLSAFSPGVLAPLWIGLHGPRQTLTAILGGQPGRSPHYWHGPEFEPSARFDLYLLAYADMGPGGILYRFGDHDHWSSLAAASATGPERLDWPDRWSVGHAQGGPTDRRFLGPTLTASVAIC